MHKFQLTVKKLQNYNNYFIDFLFQAGFTLIELLVVISVISILGGITVQSFSGAQAKARDAQRKSDLKSLRDALELYYNDNKQYPPNSSMTFDSSDIKSVPKDPKTKVSYTYISSASGDCYILAASLENDKDPQITTGTVSNGNCSLTPPVNGYIIINP